MSFEAKEIQIKFYTNIEKFKIVDFNLDMLYNEILEDGKNVELNTSGLNKLPYFTIDIKYPLNILTKKTYQERVEFFFNLENFETISFNSRDVGSSAIS
jgi:hypothetical protein